jgi:hypothetical protein
MMPLLQEVVTDKCPFDDLPEKRRTLYSVTKSEMENCQWLKPELVAQIEFTEWTRALAGCGTIKIHARLCVNTIVVVQFAMIWHR